MSIISTDYLSLAAGTYHEAIGFIVARVVVAKVAQATTSGSLTSQIIRREVD
jgi:hypothetical protein